MKKQKYKWPWEHKGILLNCAWRDSRALVLQGYDLAYVYCNWHSNTWTNVFIIHCVAYGKMHISINPQL